MFKRILWVIFVYNLVLTSCSSDLNYIQKNPENIPEVWNAHDSHYINTTGKLTCMPWWHQYHDPDLNRLIKLGMQNNNNINAAMANIEAAQGELKRVELNWLPTMGGNIGYSSFPYLGYPGVLAAIIPSYTINVFRQIKEQKRARDQLQVTRAMRDGVTLAVIAHIAGSYFSYIAQRERLYLLKQVDRDLAEAVSIYQLTYRNGLTSDIDRAEANVELDLIKGDETVIKNNMVMHQNSLRYLLNENPSSFRFKHVFGQIDSHQLLIGSLPLNIIENRPDIAEAIHELNIADAGLGIAISHFLPTIQISAARGDIATIANGTTLGTPIYFNQALLQQPLITLTSLGELARSKGIKKSAYYRYINTLRSALRDVNNDLSAHDYYTQRLDKTVEAKQKTQRVYQLNHDLYQQGIISYLQLLEEKIKLDKIKILINTHKLEQTLTVVHLYQDLAIGYGYSGG